MQNHAKSCSRQNSSLSTYVWSLRSERRYYGVRGGGGRGVVYFPHIMYTGLGRPSNTNMTLCSVHSVRAYLQHLAIIFGLNCASGQYVRVVAGLVLGRKNCAPPTPTPPPRPSAQIINPFPSRKPAPAERVLGEGFVPFISEGF
jgi:hypothetical protein